MPRRTPARVAVGALTALSTLSVLGAPGDAIAALIALRAGHPMPSRRASVALLASGHATFRAAKNVAGHKPHRTATFTTPDLRSVATAIDANGNDALICSDSNQVSTVRHLRTKPRRGPSVDASAYGNEGGLNFGFFCDGVALHGSFALAAGDSLGLLQLVRKHDVWKVDRRVRSAGVNEAGDPHVPGWIRFPHSLPANEFDNVSIAPKPLRNGAYLAVAFDRPLETMVVIEGVGTPRPRVVGSLSEPLLANGKNSFGNGGVAWLPGARSRALITTSVGFAVLDLRHPSRPRLRLPTRVGHGDGPTSITVSPDGNHVAVADGRRIFGYRRLHAAVAHGRRAQAPDELPAGHATSRRGLRRRLHRERQPGRPPWRPHRRLVPHGGHEGPPRAPLRPGLDAHDDALRQRLALGLAGRLGGGRRPPPPEGRRPPRRPRQPSSASW